MGFFSHFDKAVDGPHNIEEALDSKNKSKNKLKKIFLLLCGEDEVKRPRSKKLLKLIKSLNKSEYKIIVSGLSMFKLNPGVSESFLLKQFLLQKKVPEENIILEEQSMDTLGNLVFSHEIIKKLLRNINYPLEITLITEGFHMHRSKKLFLNIFKDLQEHKHIKFNFESGDSLGISSLYWKRKLLTLIERFKRGMNLKEGIKEYVGKLKSLEKKYLMDFVILDLILTDVDLFRLKTFEDYRNYLFSLPVYNKKYTPAKRYNLKYSIFANLISKKRG